jgi:hypothetical protein
MAKVLGHLPQPTRRVNTFGIGIRLIREGGALATKLFFHSLTLQLLVAVPNVALTQTAGGTQQTPPPIGKLVDVGGYRVHLYCVGTGNLTVVNLGAGYSFDWGLVQPKIAAITQVCAYDHSGSAWSDKSPKDSCALRVQEVHAALKNAGIAGPYVLVGHSLGGVVVPESPLQHQYSSTS